MAVKTVKHHPLLKQETTRVPGSDVKDLNLSGSLPVGLFNPQLGPVMALLEYMFIHIDNSMIATIEQSLKDSPIGEKLSHSQIETKRNLQSLFELRVDLMSPYKSHLPEVNTKFYLLQFLLSLLYIF